MNNGTLKSALDNASEAACTLQGRLNTWSLAAPLRLVPRGVAPDSNEPTHDVDVRAPHGGTVPAGVAWAKTIKRGDNAGRCMYSIALELPDVMERPLSLSAFPVDMENWELRTDRARRPAQRDNAPAERRDLDDEIPY